MVYTTGEIIQLDLNGFNEHVGFEVQESARNVLSDTCLLFPGHRTLAGADSSCVWLDVDGRTIWQQKKQKRMR